MLHSDSVSTSQPQKTISMFFKSQYDMQLTELPQNQSFSAWEAVDLFRITSPRNKFLKSEILPKMAQQLSAEYPNGCKIRIVLPSSAHRSNVIRHYLHRFRNSVHIELWNNVPLDEDITYHFQFVSGETIFLLIPPDRKGIEHLDFSYTTEIDGTLVLPEGLEYIGWSAFNHCSHIKRVVLPASLRQISGNPFEYCYELLAIDVMPGNPIVTSVDGVLYTKDKKVIYACPAGKKQLFVPDGVEQFGYIALLGCNLNQVSLPASFILSDDEKLYQRYVPQIREIEWRDIPKEAHAVKTKIRICSLPLHYHV